MAQEKNSESAESLDIYMLDKKFWITRIKFTGKKTKNWGNFFVDTIRNKLLSHKTRSYITFGYIWFPNKSIIRMCASLSSISSNKKPKILQKVEWFKVNSSNI